MKPLLFVILIVLLGIIVYRYIKRNTKDKQHQKHNQRYAMDKMIDNENKRHEDFMKSINVVNQDRMIIGEIYVNGKEEKLSVEKEENGYIYYLGNVIIGGYNPNIIGDDLIIFRENTLENQISDQIKDQIVQVIEKTRKRKEQEKERESINERTKNRNIYEQQMGYQKSIGQEQKQERIKQVEEIQKRKEYNEKVKNRELEKQMKAKREKIQNTVKDINIKQEVDMDTMATDMDTIGKRLEEAGKIKGQEKEGKLAFVESDDLDNLRDQNGKRLEGHSSSYEAVSIDKKGNVKALNLENDTQEGTNPMESNYQVKQNKNQ